MTRFLVITQFAQQEGRKLETAAKGVMSTVKLQGPSAQPVVLADGFSAVVMLLSSDKAAGAIRGAVANSTATINGDLVYVQEIGDEWSGSGRNHFHAWLNAKHQ